MTPRRIRATLTMLCLVVLIVGGAVWGWSALTRPFPGGDDDSASELCENRNLTAGERLTKDQVLVSVVNAGNRQGLAQQTMRQLVDAGFGGGETGNAPKDSEVKRVQIWTDDPQSPAVLLVSSWLGDQVPVRERATDAPGVYVVVGDQFDDVVRGRNGVAVSEPATVCSPVA